MPRPRSLSLSPLYSRTSSSPSQSPPPPPAMSIQSLMTTNKMVRYSPYQSSRLSFSSSVSGRSSNSGPISEDEGTSGSDTEIYLGSRPCTSNHVTHASTPITTQMSRLGLKPISSAPPRARPSHRRTQSLSTPPSYGFILLPQSKTPPPSIPRRHSEISPPTPNTFRTPSPPVAHIVPAPASANPPPVPLTPTRRASFDRMMLVNPAIAAHLRRGGAVNMRTPDGAKKWRVRLQREGGGLAGVMEEAERSPVMVSAAA